ncbi:MAG: YIP1 family protein [Defluviitaleaceae bacterium]|nr:YIP1 family protein [Defluviitaleaceae bacterium]MCL2263296.1 YIP1 family protein [Defluviitaleaceae bacterium]
MLKRIFKFYALPMYIMVKPFDGFYAMKYQHEGTLKLAFLNFIVVLFSYAINNQYASLVVNPQNPLELNSLLHWVMLIGALILFCVSNWSVTSLTNGEGKLKDIFMMVCYAMTPLVLTIVPATILSRFLSAEEAGFYYMLMSIGVMYFVFLVFAGLIVVHNYTVAKAVLTVVLTFIALLIIVFLLTLLLTLWQQLWVFAYSIYTELMFR